MSNAARVVATQQVQVGYAVDGDEAGISCLVDDQLRRSESRRYLADPWQR